jgi:hypothetical protein
MQVIQFKYDYPSNRTHAQIETAEFTEWYSITGECETAADILLWLEPVITRRLNEFKAGIVDTPHEIESAYCSLL